MASVNPGFFTSGWFLLKVAAVLGITGVHGYYAAARRKFASGERPNTEKFWRIMNEVPFLLMIVAIVLVVVKPF